MSQSREIVINGVLSSPLTAAQIDAATGTTAYVSASDVTAQIPGNKPWFLDIRAGVPYQFTAAQAAQIAAAGITLTVAT